MLLFVGERADDRWTRDVARAAIRDRVRHVATALFVDRGFESVTVEQISAEAGISTRSFHRYFATKEDVALGDVERAKEIFCQTITDSLPNQGPWKALELGLHAVLADYESAGAQDKRGMQLILNTPSLRARNVDKHLSWEDAVAPLLARAMDGDDNLVKSRALVRAALGAFDVALSQWSVSSEQQSMSELLRQALGAIADADTGAR